MDQQKVAEMTVEINNVLIGQPYGDAIAALSICLSTVIEAANADPEMICNFIRESNEYNKSQMN